MPTLTTASGLTKALPESIELDTVAGLDGEGRIVVDLFNARQAPPKADGTYPTRDFLFGLTLCCNASDKGAEDTVVCRACYRTDDTGSYLFRAADGSFPGLDPTVSIS